MQVFSRIICIVLDGVGVGELPDASLYGDSGSNSLANTASAVGDLRLPNLGRLGLGNIIPAGGVEGIGVPQGFFGKMKPISPGKDSTSGHWELMGCVLQKAFPTYSKGFPRDIVAKFEEAAGSKVLGNRPASGTEIIQALGAAHMQTGRPILYTSQDSVFQLAAHEDIIPLQRLYEMCEKARAILVPPHAVARVIARPFLGKPGGFYRTPRRKDFSLRPPRETVLDALKEAGKDVLGIGKIEDLFAGRGLTQSMPTKSNREGMEATLSTAERGEGDLVFTNLVDFDMMWGHRNDARAYALGLEEFDSFLKGFMGAMSDDDLLIITSDHGCDPTTVSTDHSREYVPLLVYHRGIRRGGGLGLRETFADVGKTVADNFEVSGDFPGRSFLAEVI